MKENETQIIEVQVLNVAQEPGSEAYTLLLKEKTRNRIFPIVIGLYEAHAIVSVLHNQKTERPLTHDLFQIVLQALDARIPRIIVNAMKDRIYYARIIIEDKDGKVYSIDARPSDSIALALRMGAKIYVSRRLMEEAGVIIDDLSPSP